MSSSNHPQTPFMTARFMDAISVVAYSPLIGAQVVGDRRDVADAVRDGAAPRPRRLAVPRTAVGNPTEPALGGGSNERRHRYPGPWRPVVLDERRPVFGAVDVDVHDPAIGQGKLHRSGDVDHPVSLVWSARCRKRAHEATAAANSSKFAT